MSRQRDKERKMEEISKEGGKGNQKTMGVAGGW
jgi:hypothetical protein